MDDSAPAPDQVRKSSSQTEAKPPAAKAAPAKESPAKPAPAEPAAGIPSSKGYRPVQAKGKGRKGPGPDPLAVFNDPQLYLNRELSLLEFQRRVLEEAQDPTNPLIERAKFQSILSSNLDEFFMVRVGGLKQQVEAGVVESSPDGLTPSEQLASIRKKVTELVDEARGSYQEQLLPALRDAGIHLLDYAELSDRQEEKVAQYFHETVFPVLTPLAFDPGRPFPHISNLSLNLAVLIRDPEGLDHFARVKIPSSLPPLVPLKRSSGSVRKDGTVPHHHYFVWLEEVVANHLATLFPGMTVVDSFPFHVTRNADVTIQELEADDLLETIEEGVRRRRFGTVTRLKVKHDMPEPILGLLTSNLQVDSKDVFPVRGPLDLRGLMTLSGIERHDLKETPFLPAIDPRLDSKVSEEDIFTAIRRGPHLLHHPYDSFQPVIDLLRTAAHDPNVLAIKMTLYRVGRNSPVVKALLEAQENGKQVAVLVELKARFDEESNIQWAKALERQGVHVVYGLLGLKTHSKIALIVRKEGQQIRRYVHMATGNYNAVTANLYTDIGYLLLDEAVGADATDLFNYLTGYSAKTDYRKLLVAPINLRQKLAELIDREIAHARAGRKAALIFKMNALVDKGMIQRLYHASQAGVQVDLLVRGICCLRPGLPGVSENIRVTSIVGRFLEHSRIYYFRNNGKEEVYLGSADLMPRNLNRRVEVLFPVEDERNIRHLRDEVLSVYMAENVKARRMRSDGTYERVVAKDGESPVKSQEFLLKRYAQLRSK